MSSLFSRWRRLLGLRGRVGRGAAAEHGAARPVAWSSMAAFLADLETLADDFEELLDTDVRERMWTVIDRQLLAQSEPVAVPDDLGMFSPEANRRLQALLTRNLGSLRQVFAVFELDTEAKRRLSFFNPRLRTERGTRVEDFFGHP